MQKCQQTCHRPQELSPEYSWCAQGTLTLLVAINCVAFAGTLQTVQAFPTEKQLVVRYEEDCPRCFTHQTGEDKAC